MSTVSAPCGRTTLAWHRFFGATCEPYGSANTAYKKKIRRPVHCLLTHTSDVALCVRPEASCFRLAPTLEAAPRAVFLLLFFRSLWKYIHELPASGEITRRCCIPGCQDSYDGDPYVRVLSVQTNDARKQRRSKSVTREELVFNKHSRASYRLHKSIYLFTSYFTAVFRE